MKRIGIAASLALVACSTVSEPAREPAAAPQAEVPAAGPVALTLVGPAPVELEPWRLTVRLTGRAAPPALSVWSYDSSSPTVGFEVERQTAAGFEPARCDAPRSRSIAGEGNVLWWDVEFVDARVVAAPGTYRMRCSWTGEEGLQRGSSHARDLDHAVTSDWLTVVVAPHAGNRAAYAANGVDSWRVLTWGNPFYMGTSNAASQWNVQTEAMWAKAIEWSKAATLSPGLRVRGQLFAGLVYIASARARTDQTAAPTRAMWQNAQRQLTAIDTTGWAGSTGGLAADVLRARIEVARALGDTKAADGLVADLQRQHPRAAVQFDRALADIVH